MYLAGPICEGIECAPLVIVVIASFLVPVALALAVVWIVARYIIKFFDKRRGYAMSARKQRILAVTIVAVAAAFALGLYLIRESKWYDDLVLKRGVEQVEQSVIYQPANYTPDESTVLVTKYGLFAEARFEAVTVFNKGRGSLHVRETTDGKYRYDIFVGSQKTCDSYEDVRYCYVNDPKFRPLQESANFYVYFPDKEIRLKFTQTADPITELHKMIADGWTKRQLSSLQNISYTDSILELP